MFEMLISALGIKPDEFRQVFDNLVKMAGTIETRLTDMEASILAANTKLDTVLRQNSTEIKSDIEHAP